MDHNSVNTEIVFLFFLPVLIYGFPTSHRPHTTFSVCTLSVHIFYVFLSLISSLGAASLVPGSSCHRQPRERPSFLCGNLIHHRMSSWLCLWSLSAIPIHSLWETSLFVFKFWLHLLLTMWLEVSDITALCHICKVKIIIVSNSWHCCENSFT